VISDTLDKRAKNYGVYTRVSIVSQNLKEILRSGAAWEMTEPYMRESLDMICNKLSRIVNGNPYYDDSWHDIAGYATLVEEELKGK
jgi:hypothetical protein